MKNTMKISILLVLLFITLESALAFDVPTEQVSAKCQPGLEINASSNYNAFTGITELYNFSVTNFNTSSIKWELPIFAFTKGIEFFERKVITTSVLNVTQNGTAIIEHNHNGTLENHSVPTYLFENVTIEEWKPSKQLITLSHPKYGKKINSSSTINIGQASTKYFWVRLKTIFGKKQEFDIDCLDPFVVGTSYKAGTGQVGQGFDTDINKTTSEQVNFTASSITNGINPGGSAQNMVVDDNFENNSIVQFSAAENGNDNRCQLNNTGAGPLNGTISLWHFSTSAADSGCI